MGVSGVMDTSNSNVKYHITINQNSQNVANNTSNVSVYVNFWRTNTGYSTYGSGTVYCKINGTTYSASVSPSQKITSSGIDLFSKTLDIGHNSDGTKTLTCSAWISIDAPLSSSEQSYSQTLTTIPRASSISSISGGTLGSSVTVNISRASSSFTHTVKYQRSDGQQFTVGTGIATSCTFTPSIDDSNYLPNATLGTAKIYVDTYSGGTFIGSKSSNFTVYVPSSIIPTISSVTLSETVAGITAKFGGYVQGKSKIQGVISASGAYSSTISAYTSTTNSQTLTTSTFTTNEIINSGSQSVSTTVTDSRGRTASTTTSYSVLAYTNPTVTTFTAVRANSGGTIDDQGTYVLCTINATISNVNDLNDKSFKIRYKKKSDSTYTEIDITPSGTTYTYNSTYLISGISTDYQYNFALNLTDYFTTVTSTQNVPTGFTLMDFNQSGNSIAFGQVSTANSTDKKMQIALATEMTGDLTVSGNITNANTSYFNGRRMQYIPKSIGASHGWYLVLTGTIAETYDNHAIVLSVTEIYNGAHGILYINIRRENSSYWNGGLRILTSGTQSAGTGLSKENFVIKIVGNVYYLYAQTLIDNQKFLFEVISESSLATSPNTPIFTFNNPAYTDTVSTPTGTIAMPYGSQILYSNASGTNGTITLSDSAANFSYLEIYFIPDSNTLTMAKVYNPNGRSASLSANNYYQGYIYVKGAYLNINGTSITWGSAGWLYGTGGSSFTVNSANNIKVTQVIGYR